MTMVVEGLEDVQKLLERDAPKQANNIMRSVIQGVASEIAKEAKKNVPRQTGNLRKAIKAKRRRGKPGFPVSDVIVTSGKSQRNDGFYWRFVEFGTQGENPQSEQPFIRPAKQKIQSNLPQILEDQFVKKLKANIKRIQKKRAKK
tara:strand:- start:2119 stop:2553 length:435 start_codon:yes stop_codon:yes gene_type:complete